MDTTWDGEGEVTMAGAHVGPGTRWFWWGGTGLLGAGLLLVARWAIGFGTSWWSVWWLTVAIVVTAGIVAQSTLPIANLLVPVSWPNTPWRWRLAISPVRGALGVSALVAIVWAMYRADAAWPGPAGWDVGIPWLAGVVLAGLCAWWSAISWPQGWQPATWTRPGALAWITVCGMAFGTRLLWPGRYPAIIDGDEGVFLRLAREARSGEMGNPFASGWFEVPNLYPAAMGWLSYLTGDTLGGLRVLTALVGATTVVATWRFGREVVGPYAALVGALVLAMMPFHLMFTRTALFHPTDPAALMLMLLFLHRAVRANRSGDAWLAGVMVGLGWYGYWGARSLPLVVALLLVVLARPLWRVATLGGWAAVGFLATTAPLLVTFWHYPDGYRRSRSGPWAIGRLIPCRRC